jgi:hypothetical protein
MMYVASRATVRKTIIRPVIVALPGANDDSLDSALQPLTVY